MLGVPVALILFLLVAVGLWLLLEHTTLGRSLYLIGSNERGHPLQRREHARVQIAVYILSALLGWGAALLMMAKFNLGQGRLRRILSAGDHSGLGAGRR